jgi:uncharacterized protein YkwD
VIQVSRKVFGLGRVYNRRTGGFMPHRVNLLLTLTALASLMLCAACGLVSPGEPGDTAEGGVSSTQSVDLDTPQAGNVTLDGSGNGDVAAPVIENEAVPSDQAALALVADSILARMNVRRAIDGLPSIISHVTLRDIASLRSQDMAARGYLSHQDPIDGHTPAEGMMNTANFGGRLAEVVFVSDNSLANLPAITVAAWLESPVNRTVVMDPQYHVGGVGVASGEEGWIVTMVLAERGP